MIIAMSSTGKDKSSPLDARFGRCAYFAFYNTADDSWRFAPNPGTLQGSGAGIKAAQFVIDQKARLVLTGETGPKATRVLQSAGIKVIYASGGSLEETLERYGKKGDLSRDPAIPASEDPPAGRFAQDAGPSAGPPPSPDSQYPGLSSPEFQEILSRGIIAISTEEDQVAPHFGRCSTYTLVEINDGQAENKRVIPNPGHQPGFLPRYLGDLGVNCVIAGGMGPRAQNLFSEQGIQTIIGVTGSVNQVLQDFLLGELNGGASLCSHPDGHGSCENH